MPARDIETIYRTCSRMVYWAAYGVTRRESDAMDAMQNTFLKAMSHMDQLEGMNDAQLKGWLYRVAVNLCKDALRKQRFETPAGLGGGLGFLLLMLGEDLGKGPVKIHLLVGLLAKGGQ